MFFKLSLLTILLICTKMVEVRAQACVPSPVEDIDLQDGKLSWSLSENCPETQYIVVVSAGGIVEYEYIIDGLTLDVTFLTFCKTYTFTITPVSDHLLGMESNLVATYSLPDGIDIQILNFTTAQIDKDILLEWYVEDNYTNCVRQYHMFLWHEDSDDPLDVYMFNGNHGYLIQGVASCMQYNFNITAQYLSTQGTTASFSFKVPKATNHPELRFIRKNDVVIHTIWGLENYSENRCNVTALHVHGSHFNVTVPVEDTPERHVVNVAVTGLRADSMYFFNVTSENEAGISRPFLLAIQTAP